MESVTVFHPFTVMGMVETGLHAAGLPSWSAACKLKLE